MPITVSGARRRATSEKHAAACRPSRIQASVSGWAGHHVAPASVAKVSSRTKKTAIAASMATGCWQYHVLTLTPLRYVLAAYPGCTAKPSAGQKPTKVAWRPPRPHAQTATRRRDGTGRPACSHRDERVHELPARARPGIPVPPRAERLHQDQAAA